MCFMVYNCSDFSQPHKPEYASCVMLELYKDSDDSHYVQLFYKNSTDTNIPPLEIPNWGVKCPLSEFYRQYADVLPTKDYNAECAMRDDETMPPGGNPAHHFL